MESRDSCDEIHQVFVDPEQGLVLNARVEEPVDVPKPAVTLKSNLNQSLITKFFGEAFERFQTSSAAAYAAYVASSTSSVPTNEKRDTGDTNV